MTVKKIIEYLSDFDSDCELSLIVVNKEKNINHILDDVYFVTGTDKPCIFALTSSCEEIYQKDSLKEIINI